MSPVRACASSHGNKVTIGRQLIDRHASRSILAPQCWDSALTASSPETFVSLVHAVFASGQAQTKQPALIVRPLPFLLAGGGNAAIVLNRPCSAYGPRPSA